MSNIKRLPAVRSRHSAGKTVFPDPGAVRSLPAENFDAVILPGGMPGAANLDADANVDAVLRKATENDSVIAAICAAPFVLAKRGLLNGRTFTMYPGFDSVLGGLKYTSNPAEISGNTVTGKGPGAVFAFARAVAAALGAEKECEKLYQGMFVE